MHEVDGLYTRAVVNYGGKKFKTLLNSGDLSFFSKEEIGELLEGFRFLYYEVDEEELNKYNQRKRDEQKLEWIRMNEGYYDIPKPRKKKKEKPGIVYVIKEHFSGTYKVGYSNSIKSRSSTFGVKLPFEWDFTHQFESADMELLEKMLHDKFKDSRVNGEWFSLSDEDLTFLTTEIFDDEKFSSLILGIPDHFSSDVTEVR